MKIWQRVGCELQNEVQILVFLQQTMFASSQNLQALKGYSKITEEWFWWLMTQVGLVMMKATKWQIWWVRALGFGEDRVENLTLNQQDEKLMMNVWSCAVESMSLLMWQLAVAENLSKRVTHRIFLTELNRASIVFCVYMFTMFVLC